MGLSQGQRLRLAEVWTKTHHLEGSTWDGEGMDRTGGHFVLRSGAPDLILPLCSIPGPGIVSRLLPNHV